MLAASSVSATHLTIHGGLVYCDIVSEVTLINLGKWEQTHGTSICKYCFCNTGPEVVCILFSVDSVTKTLWLWSSDPECSFSNLFLKIDYYALHVTFVLNESQINHSWIMNSSSGDSLVSSAKTNYRSPSWTRSMWAYGTGVKKCPFHWLISSELVQKQRVFKSLMIQHLIIITRISYENISYQYQNISILLHSKLE